MDLVIGSPLLKPGGCFLASDWLIATDQPSEAMGAWMAAEGLEFSMATGRDYRHALDSAGFADIRITSRNAWYRSEARRERDQLLTAVQTLGWSATEREYLEHEPDLWNQRIAVLDTGKHCPSHLFARKPRESACP